MQKLFQIFMATIVMATFTPAMAEDRNPDYTTADGKDWLYNHQIESKRCKDEPATATNIDLFYIYPTVCTLPTEYSQTHDGFVSIDDQGMRQDTISMSSAKGAFFMSGMAFASYTQVYAPFYRQANLIDAMAKSGNDTLMCNYLYNGLAYQDITAALDHYFTTLNPNGKRPFILAGHSQGSALLRLAMEHYFSQSDKVALLDSMVACYGVGFGVGKSWCKKIEDSIGVKFANDATSAKVYISWNTEGPNTNGEAGIWPKDAIAINPLTWTIDGMAGSETNMGARQSLLIDEVRPGLYGAEISDHGTVVCREMPARNYMDPSVVFGEKSLHAWDYAAYWNNVAENGMQRAAKMAGWKPVKVKGLEEHTYIAQYMYKIGYMQYEAVRAGSTYWIPKTATWAQVTVLASEGYKLASDKPNAKVSIDVTEAMQEVEIDVTGNTAVWASQRKPDYSYAKDWMLNHTLKPAETKELTQEPKEDTGVDVFFIYSTVALNTASTSVNGFVDIEDPQIRGNETAHTGGAWESFDQQTHVFNGLAYFYMPYYRQADLVKSFAIANGATDYTAANQAYADSLYINVAYADIVDALDSYFKYWNNNRPFILAAHSQGSAILRDVMEHYFTQDEAHKALLKNLVCSYQLGYGVGSAWLADLAQNTQSKEGLPQGVQFASDAKGTGCIVSWNLTGTNATGKSMLLPADAVAINPLTWSQSGDLADKSLNLGTAYSFRPDSIVPYEVSAQVILARGTVECSELESLTMTIPQFGEKTLHPYDYAAYWENIRQNANERIHTMTGKYPIKPADKVLKYDLEHHFATSDCVHYLETRTTLPMIKDSIPLQRVGQDFGNNIYAPILSGGQSFFDQLTNLGQDRIDNMDKAGVDIALLGSSLSVEELELNPSCHWSRIHNDSAYAYAQRYPDRIIPTMTLPIANVDSAIAEMQRCYDMGFRMWFARSNFGYRYPRLYDTIYEPLLAKAEELGVSIYLHPEVPTEPTLLDNGVCYAEPGLGYGQDVMKTLVRLILNGTFDRYPHLRMVVGHYGEWLPFTMDRIDRMLTTAQSIPVLNYKVKHNTDYYVRHHNILFTSSGNMDPLVYQFTMDRIGSTSCLMFGSDYPYENFSAAVHALDTLHLSKQDEQVYWQDNVLKYILSDTPAWDSIAKPEPVTPMVKTPTVRGYDFEHHYYVPAFFDTCALRTKAPYYNPKEQILYTHSQYKIPLDDIFLNKICSFRDNRIAVMDEVGMNTAVISCSEGVVEVDSAAVVALCRMSNDSAIEMSKRYPGRIMGEMVLPINSEQEAIKEMHRCYDAGMRVWDIAANFGTSDSTATHIYDAQYEPLLAEANELGLSLYIHPQVTTDADCQDFGYMYGAAMYGFAIESMRTSIRLILNGTLDRYPNLKIIIPHVGEYLPFVLERMDNRFFSVEDPYVVCKTTIREYIADHRVFVSTSGMVNSQCLSLAMKTIGVDAIVYASDYPYEDYANMVNTFWSADLTQAELDQIWGGNAEKYILTNLPSELETIQNSEFRIQNSKLLKNCQLLILRNGKMYNAQGQVIKL